MKITIPFPTDFDAKTFNDIKSYLKQLELSIIHAQKAVENAEKTGIKLSEDAYVCFEHPLLEASNLTDEEVKNGTLKNFTSNFYEELQQVELTINLT